MRLILHIGSSKTGTTTVQQFFCRNHSALLAKGIFYPVRASHTAHHVLIPAGFVQQKNFQLPHNRFYMNNTRRFWSSFHSFWGGVLDDLKEHKPHTVVLSAETLFHDFSTISEMPISQFLGQYFDDIRVVVYIRSPVPDYISRISQQIRTAKSMMFPQVRPVKSIVEYYENEFPGAVHVFPFERKQLINNDVLCDFLTKNVPDAIKLMEEDNSQFKNVALPSDLLLQLQKLRLGIQAEERVPSISTNALITWFAENYIKKTQPKRDLSKKSIKLRKEIIEFLQISATDYKWLKKKYGVIFNDLDYSKIEQRDNPYQNYYRLEDICEPGTLMDNPIEKIKVPKNKLLRVMVTGLFILKTQLTGIYRAHVAFSFLGKIKRTIY